ncbi:hypothetical protein DE146DRAFT_257612 [Phaeosphaeria sp. MPI-PUGE-AT-0046c]|nr:hypothetical protein DE146DRAFT_257612 [Phaeosphaeria sp. MPI-PUGE-AT-0046c]
MADMFAARQVRREDLHSPASSPRSTPDPELQDLLRSRLQQHFTFTTADTDIPDTHDAAHSDQEEAELRLFATTSTSAPATHKIRLASPSAGSEEAGFVVKKPRSYYFADEPTSEDDLQLAAAAIDGKAILELSHLPWPGCKLPWKVTHISAQGMTRHVLVGHPPSAATVVEPLHKRTRKSKKTRIAIRKKTQATKSKREEQAKLAKEKEEAEREKRTRRNREKKLKKKAKSQAQKVEVADAAVEQTDAQEDSMNDD